MSIHILAAPLKTNPGVSQNLINQKKIPENKAEIGDFLCEYFFAGKNPGSKSFFSSKDFVNKISRCYSDTSIFYVFNPGNNRINIDVERPIIPSSCLIHFYKKFSDFNFKIDAFNQNSLTRLWTLYEAIFKLLKGEEPTGKIIKCLLQSRCHNDRQGIVNYGKFNISWRTFPFIGHWIALAQLNNNLNDRLSSLKLYYINLNYINT